MNRYALLIVALCGVGLSAQNPVFNVTQYRGAFAKEKLTVSNSVKTLTSSVYNPTTSGSPSSNTRADYAYITVETDCMRYWPTGDNPTTTDGHKVCDSQSITIYGFTNINNLKMIRVTNDVTIQVSYYRYGANTP
jgi:hypothetical protein